MPHAHSSSSDTHQIAVDYIAANLHKLYHLASQSGILLPKGVEVHTLPEPYQVFYQMNNLLCRIHPGLCVTIGLHTIRCDLTRRHLILKTRERLRTSDYHHALGLLTRLHEDLLDRMPAGWVAICCQPPMSTEKAPTSVDMGDTRVDLADLQYKIYPVPGQLTWDISLVISIEGVRKHFRNEEAPGRLTQGFLTYLKHLAGEHPVLSCVHSVRVSPLSCTQEDLQPMSQLASDLRTVIREYRHCMSCLLHDGNVRLADEDLRLQACSSAERALDRHLCVDCATCLRQWMREWDSPDAELEPYPRRGPHMQVPGWVKRIGTPPPSTDSPTSVSRTGNAWERPCPISVKAVLIRRSVSTL